MKQRVISAIIALAIVIPVVIIGGNLYKVAVIVVGTIAAIELLNAKSNKKKVPLFVKLITIYNYIMFMLINVNVFDFNFSIPFEFLVLNVLSLLLPIVLYHDKKKYDVNDAMFLVGINILLALAFTILMCLRSYNVYYLLFILLIAFSTDIFAYVVGTLVGKHKFSPNISPNKSIEGFVGGLVFSVLIVTPIYIVSMDYTGNLIILILIMIAISVLATLGDLIFSSIKRSFDIKDFGDLMPGHGGVLDRIDSLIFVLLAFYLLLFI